MKILRHFRLLVALTLALSLGGFYAVSHQADAGPVAGEPAYSVAMIDSGGRVDNRVLLQRQARAGTNTTPVNGEAVCISGDPSQFAAALTIQGTMTGTAPTLTAVLQESIDGGVTWFTLHSFAAVNATVTPATSGINSSNTPVSMEKVSFSDVSGGISTATTHGTCFRARYTWGGTTPGLTFGLDLSAK